MAQKVDCMKHGILLHETHDDVGVAVTDLKKGSVIGTVTLEGKKNGTVRLLDNVPLGHKVAMRALTKDKPVIFNFHGYPWLIHRLAYHRTNHHNFHVRGYKEKGNINTPLVWPFSIRQIVSVWQST